MAYPLITDLNLTEGLPVLFQYSNTVTQGLFMPFLLFAFFVIVAVPIYLNELRRTSFHDIPMALAVAGFMTSTLTIILKLIPSLINTFVLSTVLITSTIFVIWFLFTRK